MKNKEFQKLLKKHKFKSNSGFTLTELLIGLFMSTFVIGALGFGLMQVLRTTQSETSKVAARNESSRALDFISDEMRRAQAIEVDMATGTGSNIASVAPGYTLPTGGTVRLALQIPGVVQRVIYSVAPPDSNSPWKGPLVIYRWGPNLNASGNYTDPTDITNWDNEALIDGVSNASQTATCGGNSVSYQGFFACVVDDDGDGITENADSNNDGYVLAVAKDVDRDGTVESADTATVDVNGDSAVDSKDLDMNRDGKTDAEDNADSDGQAITAQLYFTGGTSTASGSDSTYSADTKAVARARTAPDNNSQDLDSYTMSFRSLNPSFACNTNPDNNWKMRTDFGEDLSDPDSIAQWNHDPDKPRQPQPIKINGNTLAISSIPRDALGSCLNSRVNNGRETTNPETPRNFSGNKTLGEKDDWMAVGKEDVVAISHLIDFNDPRTFNGDPSSCTKYPCAGTPDGNVYKGGTTSLNSAVRMLKQGSVVPNYGGYDANGNGDRSETGDQPSLGEFLSDPKYGIELATKSGTDDNPVYTINDKLKPDERIIGFEIGQTSDPSTTPGFDLQDNIFIIKSDAFRKKYDKYDATNTYDPSTVKKN